MLGAPRSGNNKAGRIFGSFDRGTDIVWDTFTNRNPLQSLWERLVPRYV